MRTSNADSGTTRSEDDSSEKNYTRSSTALQMQPLRSAEAAVTEALRKAIHQGDLKPGQRLSQADLADQLGVSRIPLRDALRRLEGELLVKMDGRRGTWVSDLSIDAIKEIYELRIMLEERCTLYATENIKDEEMTKLLTLFDKMDFAEEESADRGYAARREFYAYFYTFAHRPMMRNQILLLRDNVGRYHKFKDRGHGHQDHLAFREALVNRDGKAAVRALKRHLEDARDDILRDMSTWTENGGSKKRDRG